jgi:5-methylcytosine-specific restriction endonuclease McrA
MSLGRAARQSLRILRADRPARRPAQPQTQAISPPPRLHPDVREARTNSDRTQPYCSECSRTDDLTGDHRVPLAHGGTAEKIDDVIVLCRRCNSIVLDNTAPIGPGIFNDGGTMTIKNSTVQP